MQTGQVSAFHIGMPDINTIIAEVAAVPAEQETDGTKVKEQPLPDLLAVANHQAAVTAAAAGVNPWAALSMARLITPGTG